MKKVGFDKNMLIVAVVAALVSSVVSTSVLTGQLSPRRITQGTYRNNLEDALLRQERTIERIHAGEAADALHSAAPQEETFVRTARAAYRACSRIFSGVENLELNGRFHNCVVILQQYETLGERW